VIAKGTTIELVTGRLVVDSRIGEGGMGVVWRAWLFHAPGTPLANAPPTMVALKVLHPTAQRQKEMREFFLGEAEALRELSHPNIVAFHGVVAHDGELGLAIEYIDGDTLEDVIARHIARARMAGPGGLPCMPLLRAWSYFEQLLGALAAVHALGIVHRDVKPSNVLIRRDGVVKLTDFGIAQKAKDAATPDEFAPGTGPYMSPEQVQSHPLDGRSDLYSAATVLYEMLAGMTPFYAEGRSEFMVRRDQVESQPPPLRTFAPQAPPALEALVMRALAKSPAARFASAIDMGDAFHVALGLPESPEWRAHREIASAARAPDRASHLPARTQRIAAARADLIERYRTAKMTARG
jgi:serine/threonine-protein kinase